MTGLQVTEVVMIIALYDILKIILRVIFDCIVDYERDMAIKESEEQTDNGLVGTGELYPGEFESINYEFEEEEDGIHED